MVQNSIWILRRQTLGELAARVSWNKRITEVTCGGRLQFLSGSNAKTPRKSIPKKGGEKKKKQKSSRLIRRHMRSKQRRNAKKRLELYCNSKLLQNIVLVTIKINIRKMFSCHIKRKPSLHRESRLQTKADLKLYLAHKATELPVNSTAKTT